MKKVFYFLLTLCVLSLGFSQNKPKIIYTYQFNHHCFNELGGLDFLQGYALLTIDETGGISLENKFKDPGKYLEKFWLTIDSVYRAKDWKDKIVIKITLHMIPYRGRCYWWGAVKFPPSGTIHVIKGGTTNTKIKDEFAATHPNITYNTIENGQIVFFKITNVTGNVYLYRNGKKIKARCGMQLQPGDKIIFSSNGDAFGIPIGEKSYIEFTHEGNGKGILTVKGMSRVSEFGFIECIFRFLWARTEWGKDELKIATPHAICGVRGTEFQLEYSEKTNTTCVEAIKHSVWFSDKKGIKRIIVHEGERSCVKGSGLPSDPVPLEENTNQMELNISGIWDTTESSFGKVILIQNGNKVRGYYEHEKGMIEGFLKGSVFTGKWMEAPTYKPPKDAGEFKIVFSEDGESFSGLWGYGYGKKEKNVWTGKRIKKEVRFSQKENINITGKWNTNFGTMEISQSGNEIEGYYEHDSGKIIGFLKGSVFTGKWMEAPTYKPPKDAGECILIFSDDGKYFYGFWKYGYENASWDGYFTGEKVK